MDKKEFDAVVVGSGPNGLSAAIALQREGLAVLLIEGKKEIGGGLSSLALTLPGYIHDRCSAIHPLAATSPFFNSLPLAAHGLHFVYPEIDAAHPFDDGSAALLQRSVARTAEDLGDPAYERLMRSLVNEWSAIMPEVLAPLHFSDASDVNGRVWVKGPAVGGCAGEALFHGSIPGTLGGDGCACHAAVVEGAGRCDRAGIAGCRPHPWLAGRGRRVRSSREKPGCTFYFPGRKN
jgi:phytoene dehydrogenase-like protein